MAARKLLPVATSHGQEREDGVHFLLKCKEIVEPTWEHNSNTDCVRLISQYYKSGREITINKERLTKKKKKLSWRKQTATKKKKTGSNGERGLNVAVEGYQEIAAQIVLDKDVGSVEVENVVEAVDGLE
ncbi:hypothetical protein DAPPUDRAFT_318880 [Daphnia pulex]|uniref:Uncharacterized protein n=1 Tax=Daphnia pulex TaxID=6669 RepID=E9GJX3_DAPPU|nr:hypothetical protein DAPPUDRAFT_318880 [Daphnia pulex]|eukprot:EFX80192.1 hypothetical protein DAPPUDRAFT_318880 [Daphnia pulex]